MLLTAACLLFSLVYSQNNKPVIVNYTIEMMQQTTLDINALQNDYDPDGDAIHIKEWSVLVGNADTVNGLFRYTAPSNCEQDKISYRIEDNGTPPMTSLQGKVIINLSLNPDAPVANPDIYELLVPKPADLDILSNDTDPNGDAIKILKITGVYNCNVIIHEDSMSVTVMPIANSDMQAGFNYIASERNTTGKLESNEAHVYISLKPNPDAPVALSDTASTFGGSPVSIPVLQNDYDPLGDPIEIQNFTNPHNGQVYKNGASFIYVPEVSFQGPDDFSYTVRKIQDTLIYSSEARVSIQVSKNPDCPVGVPDQAAGMTLMPITFDVLSNDYDPTGKSLEIWDVKPEESSQISGNEITYTPGPLKINHDTIYYRCREIDRPEFYSEWTPVYLDLSVNPELPIAVNDTADVEACYSVLISPLDNDIRNGADTLGLHIIVSSQLDKGYATGIGDNMISYRAFSNVDGQDIVDYLIYDIHNQNMMARGHIIINITGAHYFDSLMINNINAGVNADGMLFCDNNEIPDLGSGGNMKAHFEYPKGSGTSTIFNSLLWIGGLSDQDTLFFAGEKYRMNGTDFQPGPVSSLYDSAYARKYWKLWKLNKSDVDFHQANWWKEGYQAIEDISSWPGNGDPQNGQAEQLAPYYDSNQDGKYTPLLGDYPLIRGDQCIFFMCNDDRIHTESMGKPLKVEIHGMVYAYNAPDDSVLSNTVFVHYDLINHSQNTYYNTYAGIFTELDLGNPWDDYVGSEVTRSSFYCYNGDAFDDDFTFSNSDTRNKGYGAFPPAQSVTVLAGPFMDKDGSDNPGGGCDFSVNGLNFGNGIPDDERIGLTHFTYSPPSTGPIPPYFQYYPEDFYNSMQGIWHDETPFSYGWRAFSYDPRSVGPACNFIFPGDSDPLNWGTNCVFPNDGYNQDGKFWTDSATAVPGDRRGLGSLGPFTFEPGQVQEIELAFCAANGWNGPQSSIDQLMKNIDSLRAKVRNGKIIIPNDYLGYRENKLSGKILKIFPNPANDHLILILPENIDPGTGYLIQNILGETVKSGSINSAPEFRIDINQLKAGFYILNLNSNEGRLSAKFIKQ